MFVCKNPQAFRLLHIHLDSLGLNNTNYVVFTELNVSAEFSVLETKLMQRSCGTAIIQLFERRKVLYMYSPRSVLDLENKKFGNKKK